VSLTRRIGVATTWSVAATALTSGGGVLLGQQLGGGLPLSVGLGVLGAALGVALAQLAVRAAIRPTVQALDEVSTTVRSLSPEPEPGARLSTPDDEQASTVVASLNELFDRIKARSQQRDAEIELLTSLIERSPNGVLVCSADGRIRMINTAFRQMFELRAEPMGKRPTEVFAVPEVQELVDLARRDEGSEDELRLVPGSRTLVLRPLITDGGDVGVLAQDITAYRAAERARTDFVANVSHELRTPMAAILGYAETLSEDLGRMPDDVRPLVEAISRNSRRLRDTFEGLMHLARVEARLGELALESLRLEPILVQAVIPSVDAAGRKGLEFELDCPPELIVRANAEALDVILGNLVMNAVKYTNQGSISVRVRAQDETVRVEVHDTGIGIDPAHHDRIFERFFRVDEGRAREVGGTGLGLAMVKHLALATGAFLSVDSTPGEGSTFTVQLPRDRPADEQDTELDELDEDSFSEASTLDDAEADA